MDKKPHKVEVYQGSNKHKKDTYKEEHLDVNYGNYF